ncbi:MAG: ABC transporter ATP-binding protein [Gammaproteobacteria bacterium]|nr:MAG: ABC transporter ATP-binding protein [Gammaproteobacteria bacterium]
MPDSIKSDSITSSSTSTTATAPVADNDVLVSLKNVSKLYKKGKELVPVLTDMNLEINVGDFVALMGPSGSGKTTLLNLLGGLDSPTSGELLIAGQRIDKFSAAQLTKWRAHNVGFIFQFYNLMPVLTAEKNVELPLLLTNLSSKERKLHVAAALDLVGLSERAKHYPRELSGGQEQRVAIARALVSDPNLLLCDEPTGDLDRATADEILALMQELNQRQQKTIIMVTHDPRAADHARRTLHLDKGQLLPE